MVYLGCVLGVGGPVELVDYEGGGECAGLLCRACHLVLCCWADAGFDGVIKVTDRKLFP